MSGFMDRAKKFREEHKDTFDKVEAKSRELAEQGKAKLEEARERFDEEQAKRREGDGDPATTGAAGSDATKPDVPADEGVATPTSPPQEAPQPTPPAGSPPPPPPPPAAA